MAGSTESEDFPVVNAFDSDYAEGSCSGTPCSDAFVAKLSADGSTVLYGSYLGGGRDEWAETVALDASGKLYVIGSSKSYNFPMASPIQGTRGSNNCGNPPCPDIFVSKVDMAAAGSASLIWSTYLGGDSSDYGYGIALDTRGGVYLPGATFSTDFPTTTAGFGPTPDTDPGARDAIVAKLKPSTVVTATFVYDGDGNRVMGMVGVVRTAYVGDHAEWRNGMLTKYYYAGGERVAMRESSQQAQWLLGDHLGSTSITANSAGGELGELRYKVWGETRYAWA